MCENKPAVTGRIRSQADLIVALESCARQGKLDLPNPIWRRPFSAVQEWWKASLVRTVAGEIYRCGLRIRAILDRPSVTSLVPLPLDPTADSGSWQASYTFALACSEHMQQQRARHPWVGPLELRMLAEVFRAGSEFRGRSHDTSTDSEVRHRIGP